MVYTGKDKNRNRLRIILDKRLTEKVVEVRRQNRITLINLIFRRSGN
jgi:hypothetical protein